MTLISQDNPAQKESALLAQIQTILNTKNPYYEIIDQDSMLEKSPDGKEDEEEEEEIVDEN